MVKKIIIILLLFLLAVVVVGSPLAIAVLMNKMDVVAILPEKTKEPKLIRVIDTEAGVVCYMIQNDTGDFYSGLQCMPTNRTLLERRGKGLW